MKKISIKILSLFLAVSLLCTAVACNGGTGGGTPENSSSNTSSDNLTSSEDSTGTESEIIDLGDSDGLGDFNLDDFDFDISVSTTYTFNSNAVQTNYGGLGGVISGDWFLPDSTNEFGRMTEKEKELSIARFKQMGVSVVRYFAFQPGFAWDDTNKKWDWNSEYMKGFYEFADLMKKNNIKIILNIIEGFDGDQMGEPTVFKEFYETDSKALSNDEKDKKKEQLYKEYSSNRAVALPTYEPGKETTEINTKKTELLKSSYYQAYYGDWIVQVVNEVIVKRGYDNVTSIMYATEPNNSSQSKTIEVDYDKFLTYSGYIKAADAALKKAGLRSKVEFIGPNCAYNTRVEGRLSAQDWLNWSIAELNNCLDVYSIHRYSYPSNMGEDTGKEWEETLAKWVEMVKPTGKKFCHDEYNCLLSGGDNEDMNDPYQATQVALAQIQTMAHGANTNLMWTLWDIKFCGSKKTELPRFRNGYQLWGLHPSVALSTIPNYAYYVYCMLGTAVKAGDTVYSGKADGENFYSIMIKHKDGKYSFVAINMGFESNKVTFNTPSGIKGEFDRLVYDPASFKKTTEGKPITATSTVKVSKSWTDTIGGYNVVVYNQK